MPGITKNIALIGLDYSKIFRISLDFDGAHYDGQVTPSKEKADNGKPIYFRVMLNGTVFAYLCCGDDGWEGRYGEPRPKLLIEAMGNCILKHYN